jgi:opacity protein-like surface antigen
MRRIIRITLALLVALITSAATARAQDTAPAERTPAIEVTPYLAMGSSGSSRFGTAISFPLTNSFSLETEVGYRRGEGDLHAVTSSGNLIYSLPRLGRTTPYLACGVGLVEFGTPIVSSEGSIMGTEPRVKLAVNAGGGLKVAVDDSWSMRTDARWYKSFGWQGSEHWRVAHGVSFDVGK